MGFLERLFTNWEDKTIEYQDRLLYVVKQFKYKGKEYLYTVDKETFSKELINVVFLEHVGEDLFFPIEDDFFEELMVACGGELIADMMLQNPELTKKINDKLEENS